MPDTILSLVTPFFLLYLDYPILFCVIRILFAMSVNMLADQSSFVRTGLPMTDGGNSGFSSGFQGDIHGLPLPEDEQLWGLSPVSPTMPSWNGKPDQGFGNPNLERDLKNAHVRNGQPTPPPFDERRSSQSMYPPLPQFQLGATSPPTFPDRSHHRSLSEQSAFDEDPPYSPDMSSGSNTKVRRRKHRDSAVSKSSSSVSFGGSGQGGKREKFLERNRLAASKCRQKKKENTQQLELRYKEQSDKKELLVTEIARLRSEILGLKNEVLRHAQCGDEPIKLHLAQMVKKITYHDTSTAAPELSDAADAASTTPEDPPTPITQQQQRRQGQSQQPPQQQQQQQGTMSFGFDDALQMEPAAAATLAQQIRRESESSLASQESCTFAPTDDSFDDLINV